MSIVVPRYMWLFPKLEDKKVTGSPDIEVNGPVRAVDGGVHLDGQGSFLKVGSFDSKCLHDPSKCPDGLSLSCKLKFNRVRFSPNQSSFRLYLSRQLQDLLLLTSFQIITLNRDKNNK